MSTILVMSNMFVKIAVFSLADVLPVLSEHEGEEKGKEEASDW